MDSRNRERNQITLGRRDPTRSWRNSLHSWAVGRRSAFSAIASASASVTDRTTCFTMGIATGATLKQRTLRLSVSELAHPDSGGRQCIIDAFEVKAEPERAFPIVPVVLLLIGCVVVGWLLGHSMSQFRS